MFDWWKSQDADTKVGCLVLSGCYGGCFLLVVLIVLGFVVPLSIGLWNWVT
jgi:hypothetical protein